MWDVIVVGAGLSGITAAQELTLAGLRVLVLDKSRGLGGRLATRRVTTTQGSSETTVAVDHGCRFIQRSPEVEAAGLGDWIAQGVLHPWHPAELCLTVEGQGQTVLTSGSTQTYAVAPHGMSALAKTLAAGLSVERPYRVTQVRPGGLGWQVYGEGEVIASPTAGSSPLESRALVLALPAAQIVPLVAPAVAQNPTLSPFLAAAEAVTFDPVITVMAGYAAQALAPFTDRYPSGWIIRGMDHPVLRWMALDSSKRPTAPYPVVVAHSTAPFAQAYFESDDLPQVGTQILRQAASIVGDGLTQPAWVQVHRWRYGFVKIAHPAEVLCTEAVPTLAGCGDWCAGREVKDAIRSGQAAARRILDVLGTV